MTDRRIVEYIKTGKKKGVPNEILKKALLDKGNHSTDVEEAFKVANKEVRYDKSKTTLMLVTAFAVLAILTLYIVFNFTLTRNVEQTTSSPNGKKIATTTNAETPKPNPLASKQLDLINKALGEKYSNYKIKNYGSAVYKGDQFLMAEVDLGYLDICNHKIRADSSIIVVKGGKIIPTPLNEIRNKFSKLGIIVFDTTNIKGTNPDIQMVDRQISYDCTNNTCSTCQLNNIYEVLIRLNSTYIKNVDSLLGFRSGIIRAPSANLGSSPLIMKLSGPPPLNGSTGPNGRKWIQIQPGEVKITHKLFLVDGIGNTIYSSEGSKRENNLIFLKGEFS